MKLVSILATTAALGFRVAAQQQEIVYLVNSFNGDQYSSGMAYYAVPNVPPNQPNDYTDIVHGADIVWEGQSISGYFADSGVTFTSYIEGDAASQGMNHIVGTGTNGQRAFTCYKSAPQGEGTLPNPTYTTNGWQVYSVYWCNST